MSVRFNEDLDPDEGPPFGCFVWQAILFAVILFLIPVGVFYFTWPVWLLAVLFAIDMVLLFFVSMTAVFLLRVFFADRRRGRGRTFGGRQQARRPAAPPRRISTGNERTAGTTGQDDQAEAEVTPDDDGHEATVAETSATSPPSADEPTDRPEEGRH